MSIWHILFAFLLFFIAVFLIGLILLQRGRGGGLAGALGGSGGQSAFGSKTGDVFTKVTIIVATIWIVVCLAADKVLVTSTRGIFGSGAGGSTVQGTKGETGGNSKKSSDKSGGGTDSDRGFSDDPLENGTSGTGDDSTKGTSTPESTEPDSDKSSKPEKSDPTEPPDTNSPESDSSDAKPPE